MMMEFIKNICFISLLICLRGRELDAYTCTLGTGIVEVKELHPKTIVVVYDEKQTFTPPMFFHVYSPTEEVNVTVKRFDCVNCQHNIVEDPILDQDCLFYFKPFITWKDVGVMKYNISAQFQNITNSTIMQLEIHEPAHIIKPPKSLQVFEGDEGAVEMECLAGGFPVPDITWRRNETVLSNSTKHVIQHDSINSNIDERAEVSSNLHIGHKDNITYKDDGIYECFAANKIGYKQRPKNQSVSVKVDIFVPIEPLYKEILFQGNPSSRIQIFCAFRANPPSTHVHWNTSTIFNQIEIDNPPIQNFTAKITVKKGVVWYSCIAYNWINNNRYKAVANIAVWGIENSTDGTYITDPILISKYTKDQVRPRHSEDGNKLFPSVFIPLFLLLILGVFIWLLIKKQRMKVIWRTSSPTDDSPTLIENEDGA